MRRDSKINKGNPLLINDTLSHLTDINSITQVTDTINLPKFSEFPLIQENHMHLYSKRWVILFFFAMAELFNTVVYPVCTPIAPTVGKIFDLKASVVTLSATLYLFMHPLFTFPASYIIINRGVSTSIRLGTILTILGSSIRCLSTDYSFYWLLLGQLLSGIGRPFILNSQANIAMNWFEIQKRTQLLTFLNFMITFSGIFGQIIPSIFFYGYDSEDLSEDNILIGRKRFDDLIWAQAFMCFIFLAPLLFIIESKPPTPPSLFENQQNSLNFRQSVISLFSDKKFIIIFMSFSLFFGTFKGFGVALSYILSPFGYHSGSLAVLAIMPIIGGLFSSMILPIIYKKVGSYKSLVIIMEIASALTFIGLYYFCYINNFALILINTFLTGFFIIPSIPMMIEWGCKQTYPIDDSFCIGIMYSGATMGGSIIGQIITYVVRGNESNQKSSFHAIIFMNALQITAIILLMTIREIRHKGLISQNQSFNSVRPFVSREILYNNTDIFEDLSFKVQQKDDTPKTPFSEQDTLLGLDTPSLIKLNSVSQPEF